LLFDVEIAEMSFNSKQMKMDSILRATEIKFDFRCMGKRRRFQNVNVSVVGVKRLKFFETLLF